MQIRRYATAAAMLVFAASVAGAQGRGRGDDHGDHGDHGDHTPPGQAKKEEVSQAEQQRRIAEEQQRQSDYQRRLDAQVRAAQAQTARIQAQQHAQAQLAAHQQYIQQLQQQQAAARAARNYNTDPYVRAPLMYRFRENGTYHETTQYGADALRSAVNNGYASGYNQGRADRQDGASSNYRRSFAYQDANYGYNGSYIGESDYNYYFRQGFQRGYTDGYNSTTRYGQYNNGSASILSNILSGILGLTNIPH